ncbi:MAG: 2-C-methyl-D-erythritol 4-phosphate cytidylyltransferase [bacterium]
MNTSNQNKSVSLPAFHAVIVAGGTGNRFGSEKPKQFINLNNKPILKWSIDAFAAFDSLNTLVIVSHPDWIDLTHSIAKLTPIFHKIKIVPGGEYRQDSCRMGLDALEGPDQIPVLIHDAARPWVSHNLITTILKTLAGGCTAVIPTIACTDSLIIHHNNIVIDYPDRKTIAHVQTPQGFILSAIRDAHHAALHRGIHTYTDDGVVAMEAGYTVAVIPGEPDNKKITRTEDLQ